MTENIWSQTENFERDPVQSERTLLNQGFVGGSLDAYLQRVENATGEDFSALRQVAAHSLVFQSDSEHLEVSHIFSGFFSANAMARWKECIEAILPDLLDRFEAASSPDLMHDFVDPFFLTVISRVVGFEDDGTGQLFPKIATAQRIAEPMLASHDLRAINSALVYLLNALPELNHAKQNTPESLLNYLKCKQADMPEGVDLRYAVLAFMLAANRVGQSLGFALYGLLTSEALLWDTAATETPADWASRNLENVLRFYPSTRAIVRVATKETEVGGCPFKHNQTQVLDMVAGNAAPCMRDQADDHEQISIERDLSFGADSHKFPGEHLARLMIPTAISALAHRFPRLMLHKDKARFFSTPLVQAPISLQCERDGANRRVSTRLSDVKVMETARKIVNDSTNFSPPAMEAHLRALAKGSGRDLSPAIRIARNAMFFMSGERHSLARRAVSECLGRNRLTVWQDFVNACVSETLDGLASSAVPDLIHDFSDPLFRNITRPLLGISTRDDHRFDTLAPVLQDVLEPWLPMRELVRLQVVFDEILDLMLMPEAPDRGLGQSLLSSLLASDLPDFDEADLKALVLVLYGASFNLSHTLGNVLHWILTQPRHVCQEVTDAGWMAEHLETLISLCASPKYIYRMVRHPLTIDGLALSENETIRLQLLSINRGQAHGHLAFGHGLHHCVGAGLSRMLLSSAVPALFSRFPDLALDSQRQVYSDMSQTVAMSSLPCRLGNFQN